jgi:hypothetical protein
VADRPPISQTIFQEKNTRAETEFEITTQWLVVEHRLTFPPQDNSNSGSRCKGQYEDRGQVCLHMRDFKQALTAQLIGVVQVKFKYLLILFDVCV